MHGQDSWKQTKDMIKNIPYLVTFQHIIGYKERNALSRVYESAEEKRKNMG